MGGCWSDPPCIVTADTGPALDPQPFSHGILLWLIDLTVNLVTKWTQDSCVRPYSASGGACSRAYVLTLTPCSRWRFWVTGVLKGLILCVKHGQFWEKLLQHSINIHQTQRFTVILQGGGVSNHQCPQMKENSFKTLWGSGTPHISWRNGRLKLQNQWLTHKPYTKMHGIFSFIRMIGEVLCFWSVDLFGIELRCTLSMVSAVWSARALPLCRGMVCWFNPCFLLK